MNVFDWSFKVKNVTLAVMENENPLKRI